MGGDGYTDYKMSTDPNMNSARSNSLVKKQAHLLKATCTLVADLGVKSNSSDPIYGSSDLSQAANLEVGSVQQQSLPPLPNLRQPMIDRAEPDSKVFERAGEAIQDASAFLKDTAKAANVRPESKANPAIGQ